ncbi:MAG: hypothetical protein QF921_16595 [Pseudomonadales bacterium]|nr:hypothetical protein [Pseudomonadales bacterium]MDP6827941.1 hypothetical protein [Pseudomonadales bacterium]MDP6973104.1 hypothetical protein [Pseudomonadales bacterium]|tara:strand:+ start:3670 stop:4098 length:429 start_codon:yes stop_codon:yes gene_type:complete
MDLMVEWAKRPWWMNLMLGFCLYMAFIYMPFDIFYKPVAEDEEVWFGFVLHGWAAKATEPLHWLIYGAGAWGFWHMRSWMWPWAALYCLQVAIAMLVFNLLDERGGWMAGLVAMAVFMIPTVALWRARSAFGTSSSDAGTDA